MSDPWQHGLERGRGGHDPRPGPDPPPAPRLDEVAEDVAEKATEEVVEHGHTLRPPRRGRAGNSRYLTTVFTRERKVVSGMKVVKSLRTLKARKGSVVVRRHGKVFVLNRDNPRLKARQG